LRNGNGIKDTSKVSDIIKKDSITKVDSINYKISESDLKAKVQYEATDSIVYDAENKIFMLYTKAKIVYDDLKLDADAIEYNTDSSTLRAQFEGIQTDSTELPIFTQGDQTFTFDTLLYNFKSQRALVQDAHTKYGEGYITSTQVKRNKDQSIYGWQSIYSTCELDTPHFGIYAKKIKVIPNVVGISGPARLYIDKVPTPIILPFALYPLSKGQKAGFILPTYGFENNRGFALRNGGYYFPINEYVDLKILGDIYTYGSWSFGAVSTYTKKYSYGGDFDIRFGDNKIQSEQFQNNSGNRTFKIGWNHRIDPRKLNGASFNARVNFSSSNNNRFNFNQSVTNYLENQSNSSISYSKQFAGKYSFTIAATHNQNNTTRAYQISLPDFTFVANNLTPFARKNGVGKQKWYERINVNYTSTARNNLSFYDSAFSFRNLRFSDFRNGLQHTLGSSFSTMVAKYFNFNIGGNYNEYWFSRRTFRQYNPGAERIDTTVNNGFFAARDFNFSTGLTTTIYGTKLFKKGKIRGIRHMMIPNIGFSYMPNFAAAPYDFFYRTFLDSFYRPTQLSYYEGSVVGSPQTGKSGSINFSINNSLSAKIFNAKDTANPLKKISILDNFNMSTSYNLAADSFNLSNLQYNFSTTLFGGRFNLRGGGNNSFYKWDYELNRLVDTLLIFSDRKLSRFNGFNFNVSTSFKSLSKDSKPNMNADIARSFGFNEYNFYDFNVPWDVNLDVSFNASRQITRDRLRDSVAYSPTITIGGNITITENWKLGCNTGYDFQNKRTNLTDIRLSRDLHCWEMTFQVSPFGNTKSYNFTLAPKSSLLHDLRVTRQKTFWDYR
jgi:predicted HicB family RNase H-like nuclease